MKANMGTIDKTIRILIAITLIALAFFGIVIGTLAIIFYVVAAIFLITSFISFCPLYKPLGINTCKASK